MRPATTFYKIPRMTSPTDPGPALRRVMRAREYFTLAFGSIVGVGWMIVIDDWLARGGSTGAMLAFLLGGLLLLPSSNSFISKAG